MTDTKMNATIAATENATVTGAEIVIGIASAEIEAETKAAEKMGTRN